MHYWCLEMLQPKAETLSPDSAHKTLWTFETAGEFPEKMTYMWAELKLQPLFPLAVMGVLLAGGWSWWITSL